MALPLAPQNPNTPIPNSPFYFPEAHYVQGEYSPFILGSGLVLDSNGVLSATGGGGGVTLLPGTGISIVSGVGTYTISNTGVVSVTGGAGISVSGSGGNYTITNTAPGSTATGTVTQVNTGAGLIGGPITTTGSIGLTMTGVSPGTYSNPTITIDSYGRISFASPGTPVTALTATAPIQITTTVPQNISVQAASTVASGVVQLSDSTTSTASNTAATSLAVKTAFDAAVAAIPKSCITAKGTLVTGTGASIPVALPVGSDTFVLTADSTCAEGMKWAAAGGGGSTPPATPTVLGTVKGCTDANNTSLGCNTLPSITTGTNNVAIGNGVASNLSSGNSNVAIGAGSLTVTATGTNNVAIGGALGSAVSPSNVGNFNIGVGLSALGECTAGSHNVALGACAGYGIKAGSGSVFIGRDAGKAIDGATDSVFIGCQAGGAGFGLNWNCSVLIGPGVNNKFLGTGAGLFGQCNMAIGIGANAWIAGGDDFAIKPGAGIIDCAGSCGTAGQVLSSNGSNAIEWVTAGSGASSATPTAEGTVYACTEDGSSTVNTALGHSALASMAGGAGNVAVGICAGCAMTTGALNTVTGAATAFSLTGGAQNTFYGAGTGCALTTGNANTFVGLYAGCAYTTESSNVIIGNHNGVPGENNTVTIAEGGGGLRLKFDAGGALSFDGSSYGTANQVLISNGSSTQPTWASVNSALAAPNYGSFYDTTTQVNTVGTGTGRAISLNTTDISNNFSIVSGSQITAAAAGTYNLQFSVQFETNQASAQTIEIWLVKNGTAVPNTNTEFVSKGSGEAYFAALNYLVQMTAGDYVELYWASGDSNMVLLTQASSYGGPQIPSVILTIVPVGA